MKKFSLILLLFMLGCGQQQSKQKPEESVVTDSTDIDPREKYILNPDATDSLCIEDINRAKLKVAKGTIAFCYAMGFGSHGLRQEKYVIQLCQKHKLVFENELISDVVFEGQTRGCYSAYMDKIIADKFGRNFKDKLLAQADSILLAANDTVVFYKCDKRPQMPGHDDYETTLEAQVPAKLKKQLTADREGDLPFMDIGFYIDKGSNASGYFLNDFMDANNKQNQKLKDQLFELGVEQLQEIKHWEPGLVKGQKVITENNVRVYF